MGENDAQSLIPAVDEFVEERWTREIRSSILARVGSSCVAIDESNSEFHRRLGFAGVRNQSSAGRALRLSAIFAPRDVSRAEELPAIARPMTTGEYPR